MWTSDVTVFKEIMPDHYRDWLAKPYHLSAALQRVCNDLSVQVLYQGDGLLTSDESRFLRQASLDRQCYVRNVFLKGDDVAFCFARIVVPPRTYQKYSQEFGELNSQLLGNTLLYANGKTTRGPFQYGLIAPHEINNAQLFNELKVSPVLGDHFPARRSIFYMDGEFPLLVTEVFLAKIPLYQE